MPPRFLLSSLAHNAHLQQMAVALAEQDLLGLFLTGGVDHWRSPVLRAMRHSQLARKLGADQKLSRRFVADVPEHLIAPTWFWEVVQQASGRLLHSPLFGDWCWERSEHMVDRRAARLLDTGDFGGLISVEHQALSSLRRARALGLPAVLIFTSPHHLTYQRWVEPEYTRFPELRTPVTDMLRSRAEHRDARRDQEMAVADHIFCNSQFTAQSLIDGGADPDRVISVPLGCPSTPEPARRSPSSPLQFLYSGPVSVRKGAQYLFEVWRRFGQSRSVELHVCGSVQLPAALLEGLPSNVHIYGNVPTSELQRHYASADFLIFPTLCDGFGLVVGEALSLGLPVLTTTNAGAADLIRSGENGLIVSPGDLDALQAGMEWVADHAAELPDMRQDAWRTAHQWSWQAFRAEIIRKFQSRVLNHSASLQT